MPVKIKYVPSSLLLGAVIGLGVILASANGENYCNINCQEVYHNCTNPQFQLCLSAKSDCGVDNASLAINVILGALAVIGIIAILIRCCLFAKLLGGKKSGKSGCDTKEQEALQNQHLHLQNNASGADGDV